MLREKAQEYWLLGGILWGLMTVFLVEFVISPLFFGEDFPTFDWRFFAKVLFWVIWGAEKAEMNYLCLFDGL